MLNLELKKQLPLLTIFTIVIFYPYFFTGFTTTDDAYSYFKSLERVSFWDFLNQVKADFEGGRLKFLATYFGYIGFVSDSIYYLKFLAIISHVVATALFFYIVYDLTKSSLFSIFGYIFFLIALQNSWNHNLLTSYPFSFHLSIIYFLSSLLLYKKYFLTKRKLFLFLSLFLYASTISFFEMYVLYFPLLILYIYILNKNIKESLLKAIPYLTILILYLMLYFYFKANTTYTGTEVGEFKPLRIIDVLWQYSISAFPTYVYNNLETLKLQYFQFLDVSSDIREVLNNLTLSDIIKTVVVTYFTYLILSVKETILSNKYFILTILVSISYIFIPNLLLAITPKYQEWISEGDISYLTTHFSFYAVVALLIYLIVIINQFIIKYIKDETIHLLFKGSIILSIIYITLVTSYTNSYVLKSQYFSHKKWQIVDEFIESKEFQSIADGNIIYAPTLFKGVAIMNVEDDYWQKYINLKSGKNIKVVNKIDELMKIAGSEFNGIIYYFRVTIDTKAKDSISYFGKLKELKSKENGYLEIYSDKITLFFDTEKSFFNIVSNNFSQSVILEKRDNSDFFKKMEIEIEGTDINSIIISTFY